MTITCEWSYQLHSNHLESWPSVSLSWQHLLSTCLMKYIFQEYIEFLHVLRELSCKVIYTILCVMFVDVWMFGILFRLKKLERFYCSSHFSSASLIYFIVIFTANMWQGTQWSQHVNYIWMHKIKGFIICC